MIGPEHWYCGQAPHTDMELRQAELDVLYAREEEAERRARFEEAPTLGDTMNCETHITPELFSQLKDAEAVTVREYEREDGTRFGKVVGVGSYAEMDSLVGTPGLLIVLSGLKYLGDTVVPVADLLPPDEVDESRSAAGPAGAGSAAAFFGGSDHVDGS